jgi:hypothetical protein
MLFGLGEGKVHVYGFTFGMACCIWKLGFLLEFFLILLL